MQYKQFRYRKQPVSCTAALMLQALEYSLPKPEIQSNYGQARIIRTLVDRGWVGRDGRTITDEGKRCWRYILERFERDDNEKPRPRRRRTPRDTDEMLKDMRKRQYHYSPPKLRQVWPEVRCE